MQQEDSQKVGPTICIRGFQLVFVYYEALKKNLKSYDNRSAKQHICPKESEEFGMLSEWQIVAHFEAVNESDRKLSLLRIVLVKN